MSGTTPSIASFPAASSGIVGNISQNVAAASRRIKLESDRWPVLPSASASGPVAEVIHSDVVVGRNVETWEEMTCGEYSAPLFCMNYFIDVIHRVRRVRSHKVSVGKQTARFGPLLEEDKDIADGLKLVWPGTIMDAMQTAEKLSLVYKDQNHAICRTDGKMATDVFLQLLYRNHADGIIRTLQYWDEVYKHFLELNFEVPDNDPILNSQPPEIWIASSGGRGITAGKKGCPSFASSSTRKDLPVVYIGGGKKDTPENRALAAIHLRSVSACISTAICNPACTCVSANDSGDSCSPGRREWFEYT